MIGRRLSHYRVEERTGGLSPQVATLHDFDTEDGAVVTPRAGWLSLDRD